MLDCFIYWARLESVALYKLESYLKVFHLAFKGFYLFRLLFYDLVAYSFLLRLLFRINLLWLIACLPIYLFSFAGWKTGRGISSWFYKGALREFLVKFYDVVIAEIQLHFIRTYKFPMLGVIWVPWRPKRTVWLYEYFTNFFSAIL